MSRQPDSSVRLLFAGGGTGGHLYPAIAIADRIKELWTDNRKLEIAFVGTRRGLEYRLRETLGYPLHLINVRGLARRLTLTNLLVPFVLIGALIRASALLNQIRPQVVIGTGGYVALPILKMASVKKIATVIQEQNSYPGITTRRTAWYAKKIYLGFENTTQRIQSSGEIIFTGNPVRRSLTEGNREQALKKFGLDPTKKTVLVIGGSQGARGVNQAVTRDLANQRIPDNFQLLWQTGKEAYKDVADQLGGKVSRHSLFPYAEDMASVYAAGDLAVARAGAITLAELEAVGLPSILIPYPHAAADHQRKNAEEFAAKGFALVINEWELEEKHILGEAVTLLQSEKYKSIKQALKIQAESKPPAVDFIAGDIIELALKQANGGGS